MRQLQRLLSFSVSQLFLLYLHDVYHSEILLGTHGSLANIIYEASICQFFVSCPPPASFLGIKSGFITELIFEILKSTPLIS